MTEELARAVLTESAAALMHWFGVSSKAVWNWRRWAGVSGTATTPDSVEAHHDASEAESGVMQDTLTEGTQRAPNPGIVPDLRLDCFAPFPTDNRVGTIKKRI